jgi:hypothetical protein
MGRNNQIILNSYNQSKVFGKNNQENNQENNQADYFYQTGPKYLSRGNSRSIVRLRFAYQATPPPDWVTRWR